MTLEQLFDRARTRKIFFAAVGGIVALLLTIRYFVLPRLDPSLSQGGWPLLANVLEDVSTTIVVTVLVAAFLWWVTPERVRNAGITVVEPRELRGHFTEALATANEWRFMGGCGRYFRTAVLGEMRRRARRESTSKSVTAIVLNPENDLLCEQHAKYRAGTRRGTSEGNWTKVRVKQELCATILITKATAHSEGLLDADIFVSNQFSGFRVDQNDLWAIETREDPTAPALRAASGSYYYAALRDEFRLVKEQARRLVGGERECAAADDIPSLRVALKEVGIGDTGLDDSELEEVLKLAKAPVNPYE